jgi:hypothetical protein
MNIERESRPPASLSGGGEQSEILRALGRWLDEQNAKGFQITNYDTFVSVTWDEPAHGAVHRAYQEHELTHLRAQARVLRQGGVGSPKGTLAELLRTLGQELDAERLEPSGIVQEPGGFRVSGAAGGVYYSRLYETTELQEASARRRWSRGRYTGPAAADHVLDVLLGLPLYTQDEQRLGEVAEVRGDQFKVRTGLLHRDYWLPVGCIGTIVPGERGVVGFLRTELTSKKELRLAGTP